MLGRPLVRKFTSWVGRSSPKGAAAGSEARPGKSQGPVTITLQLGRGKSMTVLRKDTFNRAVDRVREIA